MSKYIPGDFDLRIKKARAGRGLFAYSFIPKGKCVIEYKGKVLTKEQDENSESMYQFLVSKKKTIDGWIANNPAKYINHSCRPNCEIDIYKGRVWVMAKRNIKPGEELNYDYDTDYFNEYLKHQCVCDKCRKK